ncbi:MAG TPA: Rne/Rng family ribonuclease, partial [Alphaproteobacteria bacterium]|nr:Rne/Rng family ribonuclease [Alphaproteobacteria bacterium]
MPPAPAPDVIEAAAPSGDGVENDDLAPEQIPGGDHAPLLSSPATLYGEPDAAEPGAQRDGEPPTEAPSAAPPPSDAVPAEPPRLPDTQVAATNDFPETVGGEQPAIDEPWTASQFPGDAAPSPAGEGSQPMPLIPVAEPPNGGAPPVESVGGEEIDEIEHRRRLRPTRHYKIQEVIKRRQVLLVQVVKEERGTKGAALTTYLSLAGRYCVLMPNTDRGGGISRRITSAQDRKRLKSIMDELQVPDGMAVILRTAGMERSKPEIRRDYEYLMRLWDDIRELTLKSTAPTLIYEEGNLIKRAIRDLYSRDIEEILVEGEEGYKAAKAFMKMLMPSHVGRVQLYNDPAVPLFQRFQVESEIDAIHQPTVRLKSGGYIVIGQTEALVAIDVNSGRSTRERHIEETALKTNLEAADEVARQLRLRDLAGLIVIDFIDMEDTRHQHQVERRLKEAMKNDRARIQIGRISPFGLLELSRQRLRPSLAEVSSERCPHCGGTGYVRSTESTALHVLRGIEEEGMKLRSAEILVHVPTSVAMYILNQKRGALAGVESRYGLKVTLERDDTLIPPAYRLDRLRARTADAATPQPPSAPLVPTVPQVDEIEAKAPEPAFEEPEERFAAPAEVQPAPRVPRDRHVHHGEASVGDIAHESGDGRRRRRRRR